MASKAIAIVAGVGPGTGASVARRFAKSYPVVLLARNPESYQDLEKEINGSGGKAIGISTDVANEKSVQDAFAKIQQEFPDAPAAAAIFNASGRFARAPFLELKPNDFEASWSVSCLGAVHFSQAALPLLLKGVEKAELSPTLIFTGATASVKSNALMSSFSTAKYATRALSQSLAREFAPQGIHVAHAIIDGVIDIPRTKGWFTDKDPLTYKIGADDIAESYWQLHAQSKRAFTNEIDIRPMMEKW
ncbi:NAD(P)-binding protein [Polychaeton citri CBS 116435]|uniref:NAD(P)-binding protein n=1 Tax=Polychaeton citri CBS 116435 TaxID=1314669 RepID=A0A9P4Q0A6_9PEZI|nr:NAD(P)-binding protein [Polychaeton citri CBS 116435]